MEAMRDLLAHQYDIEKETIITLTEDDATEENIILKLEWLASHVGPDDKLLIYYSGHGHLNHATGLAYWIPVDARQGRSSDYVPNSTIRDHLTAIDARHILLLSDSCFSGSLFITGGTRSSRATDELEKTPSRWALCSGRGHEEVADGRPGEHSPFAGSILETLGQSENEAINISHLVERVREQTAANSDQLPEGNPLRVRGHKGGQYVFRKKGSRVASTAGSTHSSQGARADTVTRSNKPAKLPGFGKKVYAAALVMLVVLAATAYFFWPKSTIQEVANIQMTAFQTTSAVKESIWPADKRNAFSKGDRVYIYGSMLCDRDTELKLEWRDSTGNIVEEQRLRILESLNDPFRISAYQIFSQSGIYKTDLVNTADSVLATTQFLIQ